ncbi:MAG: glycosyl hydrolase [Desulfobacterota bacterium]|nr:glycosyl hydrolase [Thermodesulfobacteriota bacterium]
MMIRYIHVAVIVALCGVLCRCHHQEEQMTHHDNDTTTLRGTRLIVPEHQAYTGAYIDFGTTEDAVTFEALEAFEQLAGKHQAIIGFSNYWGKQAFPREAIKTIVAYGAIPLIYWNPWDRPFSEGNKPDRFHLPSIIAGTWDQYIDMWARDAAATGIPLLVSWGLEMNGTWFPWSGIFYGGSTVIPGSNPPRYQGPETFKTAYRHVVDRVRAAGAKNVLWVFHPNNTSEPNEPWNRMAQYYPGDAYVDWLGLSAYGQQYPHTGWIAFQKVFPEYYHEICAITPDKPFILAEWGVGEFPRCGNKAAWLSEAFRRLPTEFPRLKAAVYWHERWPNADGSYSNLRINSSEASLEAYRKGVADPFWLDKPLIGK